MLLAISSVADKVVGMADAKKKAAQRLRLLRDDTACDELREGCDGGVSIEKSQVPKVIV